MRKILFIVIIFLWLHPQANTDTSSVKKPKKEFKKIPVLQSELPGFIPAMGNPNFWLRKLPNPQKEIWSQKKIHNYNELNLKKKRILDPFNMGKTISVRSVKKFLEQDLAFIRRYIKYDTQGVRRRDPKFNNYLKKIISYDSWQDESKVSIKYGLVVSKEAELRYFPTDLKIFRNREDREFEILKKTYLDVFSPVAILKESNDNKWFYVETPFSRGWIKKNYVVSSSLKEVKNFFLGESKGVIINLIALVYEGEGNLKNEYSSLALPMATAVYYRNYDKASEFTEIIVPRQEIDKYFQTEKLGRKKLYVKTRDLSEKYLLFTYKNLARQAFKFLGSAYSWGGSYNKTDCSLFLYRLFGSFGLVFPRSSSQQIVSLKHKNLSKGNYEEYSLDLLPFKTISFIPGPTHILLFLGKYKNKDFYIHSTWSFFGQDQKEHLIRSVVVSDLSLGKESKQGSLEDKVSILSFF